jgi:hypothetical protein
MLNRLVLLSVLFGLNGIGVYASTMGSASYRQPLTWAGGTGASGAASSFQNMVSAGQGASGVGGGFFSSVQMGFLQPIVGSFGVFVGPVGGTRQTVTEYGNVFVTIPPGSFPTAVNFVVAQQMTFSNTHSPTSTLVGTSMGLQVTNNSGADPLLPVTYEVFYAEAFLGDVKSESRLVIAVRVESGDYWLPLDSTVDPASNKITLKTTRQGTFRIMEVIPPAGTEKAFAYPNPFDPTLGHKEMSITNVPAGVGLKIYTIDGKFVRELKADVLGYAVWDLRTEDGYEVASGLYFTTIGDGGASSVITLAVER